MTPDTDVKVRRRTREAPPNITNLFKRKKFHFLINICVLLFSIDLEEKIVDEWEEEEREEKREN